MIISLVVSQKNFLHVVEYITQQRSTFA